jgi:hypothetical protein
LDDALSRAKLPDRRNISARLDATNVRSSRADVLSPFSTRWLMSGRTWHWTRRSRSSNRVARLKNAGGWQRGGLEEPEVAAAAVVRERKPIFPKGPVVSVVTVR